MYFFGLLTLALGLLCSGVGEAAVNSLNITEADGVTTVNYPIQIGRPFAAGEMSGCPVAVLDGTPVPTQADVKGHWTGGSVKHAIISFLIPTLVAHGHVTVTFQSGACNNTPLTKAEMLNSNFDFDAQMVFSGGMNATVSARQMLTAWDGSSNSTLGPVWYWTRGPIATTIILADHSAARLYDVGSDSHRSIRPIFHATFWPGINKVRVRFIGEQSNLIALQDQLYDLALTLGLSNPHQVYSKSGFTQIGGSRWTKEFWIGGAPDPKVNIDPNIAYLAQTLFIPNYDPSLHPSENILSSEYSAWTAASRDLGEYGLWAPAMTQGGARREAGYWPQWSIRWLYTGDWRMKEMAFGSADLAGTWPMNYREGDGTKTFFDNAHHPGDSTSGLGKIISVQGRPHSNMVGLIPGDNPPGGSINVGPMTRDSWYPDAAHFPEPFAPEYLLSGDFWYLEQMYFWAAYTVADDTDRGPLGSGGINYPFARAQAWPLRLRTHAAFFAPDDAPEKAYLTDTIIDAIAEWEGERNIVNPLTQNTAVGQANWQWGHAAAHLAIKWNMAASKTAPPFHQWVVDPYNNFDYPAQPPLPNTWPTLPNVSLTNVTATAALFQDNYMIFALGAARDMGFPTQPLLSWTASSLIGQLTTPGYNPYHFSDNYIPVTSLPSRDYLTSWLDIQSEYYPLYNPFQDGFVFVTSGPSWAEDSAVVRAIPAVAAVADQPGGAQAWNFIKENVLPLLQFDKNDYPKWHILPRVPVPPPSGAPQILMQPQDVHAQVNQYYASFAIVATGNPLSYQWQVNTGGSWAPLSGATLAGYTINAPQLSLNGNQYRCVLNGGAVISNSASLTVTAAPPRFEGGPAIFNVLPMGVLAAGTVQVTLSVNTDSNATCKYDTVPGTDYNAMPITFTTTGGTNHQRILSNLVGGQTYKFYVRCQDSGGLTNANDYQFGFYITPDSAGGPVITSFAASPASISSGQSSTLFWAVTGATSLSIDKGIGNVTGQTSIAISPSQTTTYTLTASNGTLSTTQATKITILGSGGGGGNPGVTATPTMGSPTTTFTSSVVVTLQDATAGAQIYFTIDGSVPLQIPSQLYSNPITLNQSATVKAIAAAPGLLTSALATASFTKTATGSPALPLPDLSGLPDYANLGDTLTVKYDATLHVTFLWSFTPFSLSSSSLRPASAQGQSAPFPAGAKTQPLASYGLAAGKTYLVSVQAVDQNDPTNKSNTATKTVTIGAADFSQVQVYPNPWRQDKHAAKNVTFASLASGSSVTLFTISGHEVRSLEASGGHAIWDLKTQSGDPAASGIYIYLITPADASYGETGQKIRGKLAIIR